MNRFLKSNSTWLTMSAVVILIVLVAFLLRPKSPEYSMNVDSTLKLANNPSALVAVENIAGKQLIDIRPANQFVQGHPEGAINIPLRQLLDKESLEILDRVSGSGKTAVLCGSDELQATAPWLLLQQLGYQNIQLLKGGIAAGGAMKATDPASTETSVVDVSAIQSKPATATPVAKVEAKKAEAVVPTRKAASSGGGC